MGLMKAVLGAAGGVMADQWKEYFYCESIPEDVMAVKGLHRVSGRSSNYKGSENIISNGSVIAVADGQCMIIVDQGKVTEFCADLGVGFQGHAGKPSPKGLWAAMERVGVSPAHTAMLGDKLLTDMLAARRAGVLALMVEPRGGAKGAWNKVLHALQRPWKAAAREK